MEQEQKSPFQILNSGGQAVVEYMLLMVIIVGLITGIAKGFGAVNEFLGRYIGDYTACLMEYGELPSLGIKDPTLDRHISGDGKKCNQKFAGFTFTAGRPAIGGTSGSKNPNGNGSGTTEGKNRSGSNDGNDGNNAAKTSSSNDGKAGSPGNNGSDENGNGGSSKSPYQNGQIARAGSPYGTIEGNDDSQRVKIIEVDEEENSDRKRKSKNLSRLAADYDRSGYRPVTGRMKEEYEKSIKNKINRAPTTTVTVLNIEEGGVMPTKSHLPQRTFEKVKEANEDNSKFTFGSFFRMLIIAAMVISIVIFFGGQIMNYSNSQD